MASGALIGLGAAAVAGLAGGVLVRRERARADRAQAGREAAARQIQWTEKERDRLRQELGRRDAELVRRREVIERLGRSRRAEREWSQELRSQLHRAYEARGALAEAEDVRSLVLRTAIELVGAEKGLLLSRQDVDRDGDLDFVCAHGFEHDPKDSSVAQRFAHEVLERDRTVREDRPAGGGAGAGTSADEEIENLVAIPLYLMDRFEGVVVCANREGGFEEFDDELLLALGDHAGAALHTQRLQHELSQAHRAAVRMLADALEARDPLLRRQAGEAALLARMLCRRLELEERAHEVIATAMLVRDIGHLGIPESVLNKPGPFSPEERSIVELHPRIGFELIGQLPALGDVASAVLYHHERFDGSGYPVGLADDAIPLSARVLAVIDAYSAIIHDRPHRAARASEHALEELTAGAGTQFDPEITALFVEEVRRVATAPDPALADAVASALDTGGLPASRENAPTSDPLTLLAGHRAFHEAAQAAARMAADENAGFTVAIVQIEGLEEVNRQEGYLAGDQAILTAARSAQRAAQRFGGTTVYRDSGRRFGILVTAGSGPAQPELIAELHTEFAIGPPFRVGLATWRPGETVEVVIDRARAALSAEVLPPSEPMGL